MFSMTNNAAKNMEVIMRMKMAKEKTRLTKLGLIDQPSSSSKAASKNRPSKKTACSLRSSNSSATSKSTSSSDDFTGLLDIEKSEIRKAEAKYIISKAIIKEEARLGFAKKQIQRIGDIAKMRHDSRNRLGAILSMRQLKTTQSNYQNIQEIVKELRELSASIGNNATKPDDCPMKMKEIVERPRSSDNMESDDDLLNELKNGECHDSAQKNTLP
jgi:hypothetical protein